jgi:two-component system sensor histidine kinase VicK
MPKESSSSEDNDLLRLVGPYLLTTPEGNVMDANEAALDLFALTRRSLVGKPILVRIPIDRRRAVRLELAHAGAGDGVREFVTRFERNGGVPFEATVRLAGSSRDGVDSVHWLIRDTTETAQTERAFWELHADLEKRIAERTAELESAYTELETRRAYLEAIVQRIPAGLVIADAATGTITSANDRALAIAGPNVERARNLGEWAGAKGYRRDGSRYGPHDWPLARALRGERVVNEALTLVRRDGTRLEFELNAAPVYDKRKKIVAAVSLFQDVTERETRQRASAEFIANAAHELRTPLAAIVSAVDVLESGAKHQPDERDRFLAHVSHEAERLVRLTRALLLLARVQSGTEAARLEIVRLKPLIADVAGSLSVAPNVRMTTRCGPSVAALANPGLLEQALTSVAGNAARYTTEGSIVLSASRQGASVRIRVRDTGRGMSPEELRRAGERFFRGEPRGSGGFGLGLAIAGQALEAMGGSLRIESKSGAGTTVEMKLPGAEIVES